jgi:DNA-binding LytR/AlgR family response regulator
LTSGVQRGLSGVERRALGAGWAIGAAIAAFVCTFNVLTRVHDFPEQGLLRPLIYEGSSYPFVVLVLPLPALASLWVLRRRAGLWRGLRLHVAVAALFFVVHVGGFTALRALAFPLLVHATYHIGPPGEDLLYELVKDVLAYGLVLFGFHMLMRWGAALQPARAGAFDIRDGQRLVRAPLEDILAVRSAGNYVEFLLADGRRPLMRKPLAALEAELGPMGFVRTHRSWLVNAGRVTGLRPEGSGDYAVELGELEAPLSRRFPEALAALRG